MIGIIRERLAEPDTDDGFILDGFPRTIPQAEALSELLIAQNSHVHLAISLEVKDEAMVTRISGRYTCDRCGEGYHETSRRPVVDGICDKCGSERFRRRADDNTDTVRRRLKAYHDETAPLIAFYKASGTLRSVDAMGEIGAITQALRHIVRPIIMEIRGVHSKKQTSRKMEVEEAQ